MYVATWRSVPPARAQQRQQVVQCDQAVFLEEKSNPSIRWHKMSPCLGSPFFFSVFCFLPPVPPPPPPPPICIGRVGVLTPLPFPLFPLIFSEVLLHLPLKNLDRVQTGLHVFLAEPNKVAPTEPIIAVGSNQLFHGRTKVRAFSTHMLPMRVSSLGTERGMCVWHDAIACAVVLVCSHVSIQPV